MRRILHGGGAETHTEARHARRGFTLLGALLVFSLLFLSGCGRGQNWVMFRGQNGRGGTSTTLRPPLGVKWKLKLQDREERAYAFNNPVVLGDTIYFGSTDGNVYALDIESGYMRWVYKTTGAINSVPYADDSKVYIGSNDGKLYALSQKDGSKVWSFQADSTIQSTIIKARDSIMFVSDGGHVYSLDPDTGKEQYTIPNPIWFYFTFQVYDNVIYFAPGPPDRPHSMGAWDIDTRSYLWILDTALFNAVWYSFPAIEGDLLYFSTMNPLLDYWELNYYAFDRKTGRQVWSYADYAVWPYGKPLDMQLLFEQYMRLLDYLAPSLWQDLVIYTSGDSIVRALDKKTGRLVWEHQFDTITTSAPTVAGDFVYFGIDGTGGRYFGEPPKVVCLSARTGKKMWEMEIDGRLLSAPVIAQNWMIFGTDTNHFYVLEALF